MKIVLNGNGVARRLVALGAAVMSIFATATVRANDIGLRPSHVDGFARSELTIVAPNAGVLVNDGSAIPDMQGSQLSATDIVRQGALSPMPADSQLTTSNPSVSQSGVGSLATNPGAIGVDASRGLIPSLNLRDSSTGASWTAYSAGGQDSDGNQWLYNSTLIACVTIITVLSSGAMIWIWRGN